MLNDSKNNNSNLSLFDLLNIIKRRKWMIAIIVLVATITTAAYSLFIAKTYKAEAVIVPLSGSASDSQAISNSLGSFGNYLTSKMGGGGSQLHRLASLLESRTLTKAVIDDLGLMKFEYADLWDDSKVGWKDGVKENELYVNLVDSLCGGYVNIKESKTDDTIYITAIYRDPDMSAKLANGYVKALQRILDESAFTVAQKNRQFIEARLKQNKKDLFEAGKELNRFYEDGRVSNSDSRVTVSLKDLDAESESTLNDYSDVSERIKSIEVQKNEISGKLDDLGAIEDVPIQVYLQYLSLKRQLLGQINSLLSQQYEMAKIEESKQSLSFQIIDSAEVPLKRYAPRRTVMVMSAFFVSLFGSVIMVQFLHFFDKFKVKS